MIIKRKSVWEIEGSTFQTEKGAIQYCDNKLRGAFEKYVLRYAVLSHGEMLKLSDAFVKNRHEFLDLIKWEIEE